MRAQHLPLQLTGTSPANYKERLIYQRETVLDLSRGAHIQTQNK